jgi:Na+/proline symporter
LYFGFQTKNDTLRHSIPYCYLLRILFAISHFTSKKTGNDAFFQSKQNSKWYLAFWNDRNSTFWGDFYFGSWRSGTASGEQFKYFQFVLGNAIGFIFIAKVLLPLYYRMNLTSIYGYIERRLGTYSYKTAATIFLISRTMDQHLDCTRCNCTAAFCI